MNPSALMRAIDFALALGKNLLSLVRTERRLGAHGNLMTCRNTSGREHHPVPAVALIKLRTFASAILCSVAVEDYDRIADGLGSFGIQLANSDDRCEAIARIGPAIHQVHAAVLVPQRRGVDHSLARNHTHWIVPFAGWILGLHHEHTVIGVTPIDIELAIMITDAGSPHTIAMRGLIELTLRLELGDSMSNEFPVDKILAVKDGQTRNTVETAGCEVIVITYRHHVGVTIVCINYRIGISSVTIVRIPYLRHVRFGCLSKGS